MIIYIKYLQYLRLAWYMASLFFTHGVELFADLHSRDSRASLARCPLTIY